METVNPISYINMAGWIISFLVGIIAIYNFGSARKEQAVKEGKRQQEIDQLATDVRKAWEKIHVLESGGQTTALALVEIQTTLKFIRDGIQELKDKLGKHCDEDTP